MRHFSVAASLIGLALAAPPAQATSVVRQTDRKEIRICNNTNLDVVAVAVSAEYAGGASEVSGWYRIAKNNCGTVHVMYLNGRPALEFGFWGHGFNGGNEGYWPTTADRFGNVCVSNDRFTRMRTENYKCTSGEELKNFGFFRIRNDGVETWTMRLTGTLAYSAPASGGGTASGPSASELVDSFATGVLIGSALQRR